MDSFQKSKESNLNRIKSIDNLNSITSVNNNLGSKSNSNIHSSDLSVYSNSDREVVLYLGFEDSWERDLWSNWLQEVSLYC
jgi:hypothetical protein